MINSRTFQSRWITLFSIFTLCLLVTPSFSEPQGVPSTPSSRPDQIQLTSPKLASSWRPSVEFCPTFGVDALAVLEIGPDAGETNSYLASKAGGDFRLLWIKQSRRWGMGLRVAVSASLSGEREYFNFDLGYVIKLGNFWASGGPSLLYLVDRIALPALTIAAGYDIPLGDHLALRFQASGTTVILWNQASFTGGLVARF